MIRFLLSCALMLGFCFTLTSCPEDKNSSLPGSQWLLQSIDNVAVVSEERIEFTSSEVHFYEDLGECWDFYIESFEIHGDSLIMNGGEYMVGFELDGDHLHILTGESEWIYSKDDFDPSTYTICEAVKHKAEWKINR